MDRADGSALKKRARLRLLIYCDFGRALIREAP